MLQTENKGLPAFPIICIGGSAGSLCAYVDILKELPANAGLAIVIVSHRSVENPATLIEILAQATRMKVVEATNGMLLEVGRVFIAPPHRQVTTDGTVLKIAVSLAQDRGLPTLISKFIVSLAKTCAARSIAIIVSGTGDDGSDALSTIKEVGGWTLAQSDARDLDMPQSAIDTSYVDFVLRANEIGKYLASLSAHLSRAHA